MINSTAPQRLLFAILPLMAVTGWAQDKPHDSASQLQIAHFQACGLYGTALELLGQPGEKGLAGGRKLLVEACNIAWSVIEKEAPQLTGSEKNQAYPVANQTSLVAKKLLTMLPAEGEGLPLAKDVYCRQVKALALAKAPIPERLAWEMDRLEYGSKELRPDSKAKVNLSDVASWIAQAAGISKKAPAELGKPATARIQAITGDTLKKSWQDLAQVPGMGKLIAEIVGHICAVELTATGRENIRKLLDERVKQLYSTTFTGDKSATTPQGRAKGLFYFYQLLAIVHDAHRRAPQELTNWGEKYLAKNLGSTKLRIRDIPGELVREMKGEATSDLTSFVTMGLPLEKVSLGLFFREDGQISWLQNPDRLGLTKYYLPPGPYPCVVKIISPAGKLMVIFQVPLSTNQLTLTIPRVWPGNRCFIPIPGQGQKGESKGWDMALAPLVNGKFGRLIFSQKQDDRVPLSGDNAKLFKRIFGDLGQELYKTSDLESILEKASAKKENVVKLDYSGAKLARQIFLSTSSSVGTFALPPIEVVQLYRQLQVLINPTGPISVLLAPTSSKSGSKPPLAILGRDDTGLKEPKKMHYLVLPARMISLVPLKDKAK